MTETAKDRATIAGLWLAGFFALLATQHAVGFVRDESVYFAASEAYSQWFQLLWSAPAQAFQDANIVRFFGMNHEHPVLMKTLFGLSHALFHRELGWAGASTAFRLPALALAAAIPALLFGWGRPLFGRTAALFAALSFLLVPRQYFNAELACFDMPIAALWCVTVYAFWRAQRTEWGWLGCGIAFGLALATKHNALFIPGVLFPFAAAAAWSAMKDSPQALRRGAQLLGLTAFFICAYALLFAALGPVGFQQSFTLWSAQLWLPLLWLGGALWLLLRLRPHSLLAFRALASLWAMAALGPALFYAHWPYLWHHPVDRTAWYLAFHAQHNHYAWFYLGKLLRQPPFPWAYVLVVTALTVPLTLLAPMALGCASLLGRAFSKIQSPSWSEWLVGANAVASIAIISHPQVPHFGGVKHWLPSMPFLALLSGQSVARVAALVPAAASRRLRLGFVALLFTALLSPALWGLVRVHPYGTSFYSELAGGLPGAASLGMQRQFWSNNVTSVLPWINIHASANAGIYLHEVNGYSFRDYQENGLLRRDLRPSGPNSAEIAAYQYHQEFREQELEIWNAFGTEHPATGLYLDETPQVVVYRRSTH